MRKVLMYGAAALFVAAVLSINGVSGQRPLRAASARTPTQVEVVNFPAAQPVDGTVNVGNLPAVQTVGGSITVSNLPLDADGNLRITALPGRASPAVHLVGTTQAAFSRDTRVLALSHACVAEFPNARVCAFGEIMRQIPPPTWTGTVLIVGDEMQKTFCLAADGGFDDCTTASPAIPVACCGF